MKLYDFSSKMHRLWLQSALGFSREATNWAPCSDVHDVLATRIRTVYNLVSHLYWLRSRSKWNVFCCNKGCLINILHIFLWDVNSTCIFKLFWFFSKRRDWNIQLILQLIYFFNSLSTFAISWQWTVLPQLIC